jgi:hypothetical protein
VRASKRRTEVRPPSGDGVTPEHCGAAIMMPNPGKREGRDGNQRACFDLPSNLSPLCAARAHLRLSVRKRCLMAFFRRNLRQYISQIELISIA